MNTGDVVTDSHGRSWQVGQSLGRGLWGSSYVVRSADDGRELVLKVAHGRTDFPADARLPEGIERACAACIDEQAALLRKATHAFLPRLEDRLVVHGKPALLVPRYASTLARRLVEGMPLGKVATLLGRITTDLEALPEAHGNLRPSNVLLKEDGTPVLADVLTTTGRIWRERLEALTTRTPVLPPEATDTPRGTWDTWALCTSLYASAMWVPSADGETPSGPVGLDKVEIATLKDRANQRLRAEGANPRFIGKACERLASLLNRGLSEAVEPSPPYRFHTARDLGPRLSEVAALVHPRVESVGKLLLPSTAPDGVFTGGAPVEFSVTVEVTEGVTGHEHIACGLRVVDLDSPDHRRVRIEDASFDVRTHPSGRFRFHFALKDVPPGRYAIEAAFSIQDSGDAPLPAKGEVLVRPPPGYVPPIQEEPDKDVLVLPVPDEPEDPIALDAARFPRPIAPTASADTGTSPTAIPSSQVSPTAATSIDLPRPTPGVPRPTPTATVAGHATVASDPGQETAYGDPVELEGPGTWGALPDPDEAPPPEADPYLPDADGVTDLPAWTPEDANVPAWQRWLDAGRRDTFVAITFATALLLVVFICLTAALQSCG